MLPLIPMVGVITTRDVLRNLGVIRREFGVWCLVRAMVACVRHRKTTFLEIAVAPGIKA